MEKMPINFQEGKMEKLEKTMYLHIIVCILSCATAHPENVTLRQCRQATRNVCWMGVVEDREWERQSQDGQ